MTLPQRFYESPQSRFIVTDLQSRTVTFLDRLATNRRCTHTRNAPFELTLDLPSDNPEVNLPAKVSNPEQPFVDEGLNMIYWFLRFGYDLSDTGGPWECVGAAIILHIEDVGEEENPVSHVTAYDPWKLLYKLPVVDPDTLELPDPDFPVTYGPSNGCQIAYDLLTASTQASSLYSDFVSHIDTDPAWIDDASATAVERMEFSNGVTVGEAWDQIVQENENVGIWLKPVYDPVDRPGVLCELHCTTTLGQDRPEAIFAWDRWPRSLVHISREQDGEQRANFLEYYVSSDQIPVPPHWDEDAIDAYGLYWETQSLSETNDPTEIEAIVEKELALRKTGSTNYQISPAAERAPMIFKEYHLHDTVHVYASKRLRRPIVDEVLRVESIPVVIDDDQLARVDALTVAVVPPEA